MPIVRFSHDPDRIPEGAENVRTQQQTFRGTDGEQKEETLYLWNTHTGLCLFEGEINRYHDSDFYMVVWNPEAEKPERIFFATTRGWTYPSYASHADATPEVQKAYEAWKKADDERKRREEKARREARVQKEMEDAGLSREERDRLFQIYGRTDLWGPILKLLCSDHHNRLRSDFRKSLARQIREWLSQENPQYRSPLSPRQEMYV